MWSDVGENPETDAPRDKAPLEILKERYARGELERDEFDQKRRDHERYTNDTLRRAISQGLDPSDEPLDEVMPRWNMSERDWQDLLAYLRNG